MSVPILRPDELLAAGLRDAAAALGNLDGVHRGHASVVEAARARAEEAGAPLVGVCFEPHPRRFFKPQETPFLLTELVERAHLLGGLGVRALVAVPFDAAMAATSPGAFVRDVLVEGLGLNAVAVGRDFRYGARREGDLARLTEDAAGHGLTVIGVAPVRGADGARFASSDVRQALRRGDVAEAAAILGRPWAMRGCVVEGEKRGRTIGFPTANLRMGELVRPARGVYAVRVETPDGHVRNGVANFGRRPTFDQQEELLEVHIFDFDGDLYAQTLRVALHAFLRPERRFDGIEALKAQIVKDCEDAKSALASP